MRNLFLLESFGQFFLITRRKVIFVPPQLRFVYMRTFLFFLIVGVFLGGSAGSEDHYQDKNKTITGYFYCFRHYLICIC
jgi:hypothetical protein